MTDLKKYNLKTGEGDRERLAIVNEIYNHFSQQYMLQCDLKNSKTAMDIGCGTGEMAIWMAQQLPHGKVIAIDNSQQQLDIARTMAQQEGVENIEFILHDVYDFESLNIKSDFIYSRWLLLFLSKPKAILKMFFDKLNEGGVIICESLQQKNSAIFSCPPTNTIKEWMQIVINYAFAHMDMHWETCFNLYPWLKEFGATKVDAITHQPILKTPREKSFFRLGLLTAKTSIINNGCPESKYDALIQELHSLENDEDTILGCYRNLLVSAIK